MVPMTVGFLIARPVSGWLLDRYGAQLFASPNRVAIMNSLPPHVVVLVPG